MVEITGKITASEQRPNPARLWIAATRRWCIAMSISPFVHYNRMIPLLTNRRMR
jgi:hypothetical protein